MKIIYKQNKILSEIKDCKELENFIITNRLLKNFKSFDIKFINIINDEINKTDKVSFKIFKNHFIKKWVNCGTFLNPEYWIQRGWSMDGAIENIKKIQSNNSKKSNKKNKPWTLNTRIEFWLKKGYSQSEAAEKLRERQSCFSRTKLIKKHGEKIGNQIVDLRNKKWVDSLKKNNDWNELSFKKGNNGLNKNKSLNEMVSIYGELEGRIMFSLRYWGKKISTIKEFNEIDTFKKRERTTLFYDKDYRFKILSKQNFSCGECGISNKERLFHLHHIDFDKKNDRIDNLIFLCHNCHAKTTNSKLEKRKFLIEKFNKLNEKYN
jgi:hypothetical protein